MAGEESYLSGVPFFKDLNKNELEDIALMMKELEFPQKTLLIEDGSLGSSIYIIKDGTAKVTKMLDEEKEEIIAVFNAGDCIGEMSMFDHRPRSANVVVDAGTRLFEIPGKEFEEYLNSNKELALKVYKAATLMLCQRLREANQILVYSRLILYNRQ